MEKKDVVIIGGGPAGFCAARTIVSVSSERKVTVINSTENTQIPCSIPFVIGRRIKPEENIYPLKRLEGMGVEVIVETVTSIDADRKSIFLSSGKQLSFEKLIVATGWVPRRLPFSGVEYISTDTDFVRGLLGKIERAENIVIVGAGFIGIGFADAIAEGYGEKRVTVIEAGEHIAGGILPENVEAEVVKTLEGFGIELITGEKVVNVDGKGVEISNGRVIDSDLTLAFIGFKPNSRLAIDAGIEVNSHGEIVVDGFMRTSKDSVLAAGSCVQHRSVVDGERVPAMLASISAADGRLSALNVNGPAFKREGIASAAVSKAGKLFFGFSGFTERICSLKGIDFVKGSSKSLDRYPGAMEGKDISVELLFSKDGRLIGSQVWGESEKVSNYINITTRLIEEKASVDKVVSMTTVAFPPLTPSPLSTPIQYAAVDAKRKL